MFQGARLKLTAWYLLIITSISVAFSIVIYKGLTLELDRFSRMQRFRIERRLQEGVFFPPDMRLHTDTPRAPIMDPELIEETKQRLTYILLAVNGAIIVISGGLSYFLAGRTLRPIKDMLDEQNRFITDASHELRTPLTSLKSAMEVHLRAKHTTAGDTNTLIRDSIDEVNKLQSLSDNLLQLTQFHKPNGNLPVETVSVSELIDEAIRKVQSMAEKKHITITKLIGDLKCMGNRVSLVDLIVILLDNAIKYSLDGKYVDVQVKKTDGSMYILVKDNGIGIGPNDLPHVFDRFYRGDTSRSKTAAGGFGLGLSIAKKIAENHHGSITVDSKENTGTTFTVRLPAKQPTSFIKPHFFS